MKAKIRATAQKLVNLYRQAHVIVGGWSAVNPIFIEEANDEVLRELQDLPTGKMLMQHIENLRSGKTSIDSIERELLPYGGMMSGAEMMPSLHLTSTQLNELKYGIETFTPNQEGLDKFTSLDVVRNFGEEWVNAIDSILQTEPQLHAKWASVKQTFNAYRLWNSANTIITQPLTERVRAQVQAEMPDYETYLPLFGDAGTGLLNKLRTFISAV
ncbi:MAG: hypothetical protein IKZ34_00080 [Alphaproteobacteria bacterium]|nr:hypothetical protein [Alphaproteobacteria bacterium]